MGVVHSPILGCETSLRPLVEWLLGAPPPNQLRCIFLHRNTNPFSLLFQCVFRGCFQWILMTSDSNNARVNEESALKLGQQKAHLALGRNMETIYSGTDPEGP
jgi:hypothetical protein